VSSEANATVDDLCSVNGANTVLGTTVNYVAVESYVDYANPQNSAYFYREPGASGACNTTTDKVFMVKLGMATTDAPIAALMPAAVVHDSTSGAITGFIVNEGTALTHVRRQFFANRTVIYTPTTAMSVVYSLANSGVGAAGGLFVIDGSIVYVNYASQTVSASLFTVPNWSADKRFANSANGSTEFFTVNTSNEAATPLVPTSAVYSMPLDGSAAPTQLATESGIVSQVTVAIYGTTVAWSVVPPGRRLHHSHPRRGRHGARDGVHGNGKFGQLRRHRQRHLLHHEYVQLTEFGQRWSTRTRRPASWRWPARWCRRRSRIRASWPQERDSSGSDWVDIVVAQNLSPVTVKDTANGDTYTEDGISGCDPLGHRHLDQRGHRHSRDTPVGHHHAGHGDVDLLGGILRRHQCELHRRSRARASSFTSIPARPIAS
jgi:hypothetical protein